MNRPSLAQLLRFLVPAYGLLLVFQFWPFLSALRLSLFHTDGLGPARFAGLENFLQLAHDPLFGQSLRNVALFLLLGLPPAVLGPLLGAKMVYELRSARAAYVFRVLFVLPVVIPMMTSILMWRELYSSDGAVNQLLLMAGLGRWRHDWLGDSATAIGAILFTGMPWTGGINFLIYLAALMNIDRSLYEAARIDGASPWHIFRTIEWPLVQGQLQIVLILSFLGILQNFENILILTDGGPANATLVPALYLFKSGFAFGHLGYASAIGVVLFAACLGIALANARLFRNSA